MLVLVGLLAAVYTIWPSLGQGGGPDMCPIWADISFTGSGFQIIVGPPLFAWPQFVLAPGHVGYIIATYHSPVNSVGFMLEQFYSQRGFVVEGLWKIDETTGKADFVPKNQTAAIVFVSSMMFQGDHTAIITYVVVGNNATQSAVYVIRFPSTCWGALTSSPDVVLRIGSWPYLGPLPAGTIQLASLLMNLAGAEILALTVIFAVESVGRPHEEARFRSNSTKSMKFDEMSARCTFGLNYI